MNKTPKFILTSLWILVTRSCDAYCTYLFTPNLKKEANPLVSILGLGWTPLLLIVFSVTLYSLWCLYQVTYHPMDLLPEETGYSLNEVSGYVYLGKRAPWFVFFYALPHNMRRFHQYMGHILSRCLVYAGWISTVMWLLIKYSEWYRIVHSGAFVYVLFVAGCGLILFQWYAQQYHQYLKKIA